MKIKRILIEEANERKADRNKRSTKQQLDLIAKRPGSSTREVKRLTAVNPVISAPVKVVDVASVEVEEVKKPRAKRKSKA